MKALIAVLAAVAAIAALYVFLTWGGPASNEQVSAVSEQDIAGAIDEAYSSVIQEELDSMTVGQDEYVSSAQDDMLDDMSSFYE